MAELSRFFDAEEIISEDGQVSYSPSYSAEEFSEYFASFISDGVYAQPADQLKVFAKEGLTLTIKAGKAWIEGHLYVLTEDMDVTLNPNLTSNAQQVKVVCVLLRNDDKIATQIVQGAESLLPVNDGTRHELVLASFVMPVGTATLTDAMIADRRPDNKYCGFVAGLVREIQTTDLFSQYDSMFNEWFEKVKADMADFDVTAVVEELNGVRDELKKVGTKFMRYSVNGTKTFVRYQSDSTGKNRGLDIVSCMRGSDGVGSTDYFGDPYFNVLTDGGVLEEGMYLIITDGVVYDMYSDDSRLPIIGTDDAGESIIMRASTMKARTRLKVICKKEGESDVIIQLDDFCDAGGGILKKGKAINTEIWKVSSISERIATFLFVVPKGYTSDEVGIDIQYDISFPYIENIAKLGSGSVLADVNGFIKANLLAKII